MMQLNNSQYVYTDIAGLSDLKRQARLDKQSAIKEVAKQFESLFMNMMLKSMRDASMGDPIFDSSQSLVYRDMLDRQLSLSMSKGKGMGLAQVIERQLMHQVPGAARREANQHNVQNVAFSAFPTNRSSLNSYTQNIQAQPDVSIKLDRSVGTKSSPTSDAGVKSPQEKFIRDLWPMAVKAAEELDTLPEVIISQAALETGWGKHVTKYPNGMNSYNLFNIKAGKDWDGDTVNKVTIEYRDGVPVKEVSKFRSYDSYEDSFSDYVEFLKSNKRYEEALRQASDPQKFIHGLHRAGYATDPDYADKIMNIINREWDAINKTISLYEGNDDNA